MAISGLPTVPGLDCEDFGLVDPLGLCPMAGLWRLNLVPILGLPIVVGLDFDHFGLILANFCFQISPLEAGFWPFRG